MSKHVLLSARSGLATRLPEVFPDLKRADDPRAALQSLEADAVIWTEAAQLDWLRLLRASRPELPVVALSFNPQTPEALNAFDAGARGYCHALAVPEMLQQVATVVGNGGLWLGPELMRRATSAVVRGLAPTAEEAGVLANLTQRERDVALRVANGASNKEIAQLLEITPRTVKAHMAAIFDKLGVRDRLQLVLRLRKSGVD